MHNSKLILSRKKASMQASTDQNKHFKQVFTKHTLYPVRSEAQTKGSTAKASHLYRVVFALNPDIESQGEADER